MFIFHHRSVLLLGVGLFVLCMGLLSNAHATPITYQFTSGDLSGTVTFNSALATNNYVSWSYTDTIGKIDSTLAISVTINNSTELQMSQASGTDGLQSGDLKLNFSTNVYTYDDSWLVGGGSRPNPTGTGSFSAVPAVPEPQGGLLLSLGLLILLGYSWQQRRQGGVQVG